MNTLYINGQPLPIDTKILLLQTSALGRIIGPPPTLPTPHEAALLEGVWHMLHKILDSTDRPAVVSSKH